MRTTAQLHSLRTHDVATVALVRLQALDVSGFNRAVIADNLWSFVRCNNQSSSIIVI